MGNIEAAHKINTLLQNIFSAGIQNVKIKQHENEESSEVTVQLAKEECKQLDGNEELFIPQKLKFTIDTHGISFKEGYAPSEFSTACCGILANQSFWKTIRVNGNFYEFRSSENRYRFHPTLHFKMI